MKSFSGWMPCQGLYALEKITNEIFDGDGDSDANAELARQLESEIYEIDKQAHALALKFRAILETIE